MQVERIELLERAAVIKIDGCRDTGTDDGDVHSDMAVPHSNTAIRRALALTGQFHVEIGVRSAVAYEIVDTSSDVERLEAALLQFAAEVTPHKRSGVRVPFLALVDGMKDSDPIAATRSRVKRESGKRKQRGESEQEGPLHGLYFSCSE